MPKSYDLVSLRDLLNMLDGEGLEITDESQISEALQSQGYPRGLDTYVEEVDLEDDEDDDG
jgi:hypothetical protein